MTDIDVHHLAAAYALDAIDERERIAFEAHYGSCEVCHSDVHEFRETLAQLGGSLAVVPPPTLKDKVMGEVALTRQLSPLAPTIDLDHRRRVRAFVSMAAAAAAVVMIVVGVVAFGGRNGDGDGDEFAADLAHVMEQPDSQVLSLESQAGGDGTFKVAWSTSLGKAVLIGEDLPAAPSDKAYELWLINGDQATAMYVLDPATDGNVHHTMVADGDPTAWAITIEPKAGTPVATGDIIFLGSV